MLLFIATIAQANDNKVFDCIVDQNGLGDYISVQAAINAAPDNAQKPYLIFIMNGIYDEIIDVPKEKTFIHLIGQDCKKTIIRHMMHCGGKDSKNFELSTNNPQSENYKHNAVMDNNGSDFYMENVTIENSWGTNRKEGPQALAIRTLADRMAFFNCRFLSFQDTWFTTTNDDDRHYIKDCYLEGAVDYIFGGGDVLAENTTFYNVRSGSIITAPSQKNSRYGYIFRDCVIDGNSEAADGKTKLGRPWHNNPVNIWINTTMRIPISNEGWNNMGTVPLLFAEYNSHDIQGKAINISKRKDTYTYVDSSTGNCVTGKSRTTINNNEADTYTYENIIQRGDNWNPRSFMTSLPAPKRLVQKKSIIQWQNVEGARGYIIYDSNQTIVGIVKTTRFQLPANPSKKYTICAVNEYGHIGNNTEIHITSFSYY